MLHQRDNILTLPIGRKVLQVSPSWKTWLNEYCKIKIKSDTSIKNMTELVGSHTASIQKLEMQMGDLTREKNPKQKGTLPSDTIANPKGSGSGPNSHCMAITT